MVGLHGGGIAQIQCIGKQGVTDGDFEHALIADALELGYAATVQAYQACIDAGFAAEKNS